MFGATFARSLQPYDCIEVRSGTPLRMDTQRDIACGATGYYPAITAVTSASILCYAVLLPWAAFGFMFRKIHAHSGTEVCFHGLTAVTVPKHSRQDDLTPVLPCRYLGHTPRHRTLRMTESRG